MRTFARALASQAFTVTAELSPLGNMRVGEILQQAKEMAPFVDGVQVTENPQHRMQMSPVAMAALLLREGIYPVTHLNCRDRNRLALQSDLVGLRALGVSSLILNRGNLIQNPGALTGKPVYDINCRELISMAAGMSEKQPGEPGQEFMIGTSAIVFRPNADWKAELYQTRAKAGARFLQTQPCFSVPMLRHFMQRLVDLRATWKFAVVVTLAPLPGMEAARWQFENAQGAVIPKTIINEVATASDPEQAGIAICARQMREIAAIPGVSGVNLLTLGNPAAVIAAIKASGLRPEAVAREAEMTGIIK
jgi:methylenetetrahydrofolate reductase (NADPH)